MLTKRQKQILEFIEESIYKSGYPPSVREICKGVGLSSTSTVHSHLSKLQELGYLRRDKTKPRALEILKNKKQDKGRAKTKFENPDFESNYINIPLVGDVTAGEPILAEENIENYYPLPNDFLPGVEEAFLLRISGDSMIDAGIHDGDLVIVNKQEEAKNGEIIVALLEEDQVESEATVKRFYKENSSIRLEPENPKYSPIHTREIIILGKVIGLLRKF